MHGSIIKYHRRKKKLKQAELAKGICSVSYLSKLENDNIEPNEDILAMLYKRLEIDMHDFSVENIDIKEKILEWYSHITAKEYDESYNMFNNLTKAMKYNNDPNAEHLFEVVHLCYTITFETKEKAKKEYKRLLDKVNMFNDETKYYFYKFESLIFYYDEKMKDALASLKKAEKLYTYIGINDSALFYNLSVFHKRTYNLNKSIIYAMKALDLSQEYLNFEVMVRSYLLITTNYISIGEYEIAEEYLNKINRVDERYITRENKGIIYSLKGYIYYQRKEFDQALTYLHKAKGYRDQKTLVNTIYLFALVYITTEANHEFKNKLIEGYNLCDKYGSDFNRYRFYILENKWKHTINDLTFITKMEQEIIPYFEKSGAQRELISSLKLMGDIFYNKRQYKKSAEYYRRIQEFYKYSFPVEDYL
ncbi:helix-turn-helix domain-containing protein [Salirhabdus salicampi]|uniref:helix-turn-helix domain-containing protein n=1 Tax=Salirhabdus salicampi TaxID=476102 RepID=UPI0020C215F8|nr:helix-turn-helix transcriptional regulator [Salirhabdus salicampi]MCP8618114.1 helix-turn-helix domain-containing protein [Salirhabdus salicampi]